MRFLALTQKRSSQQQHRREVSKAICSQFSLSSFSNDANVPTLKDPGHDPIGIHPIYHPVKETCARVKGRQLHNDGDRLPSTHTQSTHHNTPQHIQSRIRNGLLSQRRMEIINRMSHTLSRNSAYHQIVQLTTDTDEFLSSSSSTTDKSRVLSLIHEWGTCLTSFVGTFSQEEFKDGNEIVSKSAQHMDDLLQCYLKYHVQHIQDSNVTNEPFSIVINAWNQCNESTIAGYRAASILDQWGDLHGGDITLAPSIDDFNMVLHSYSKTSAYLLHLLKSGTKIDNIDGIDDVASLPGVRVWEIYVLLSGLSDLTGMNLKMNAVTFVHVIESLSNHSLLLQRMKSATEAGSLNKEIDAREYATRALSAWNKMISQLPQNSDVSSSYLHSAMSSTISAMLGVQKGFIRDIREFGSEDSDEENKDRDSKEDLIDKLSGATLSIENLLHQMKSDLGLTPRQHHYQAAVQAYSNLVFDSGVTFERFESEYKIVTDLGPSMACSDLLEEFESIYVLDDKALGHLVPSSLYRNVLLVKCRNIKSCTKLSESKDQLDEMESILQRLIQLQQQNKLLVDCDMSNAFNQLLMAYSQCDSRLDPIKRSLKLVSQMKDIAEDMSSKDPLKMYRDEEFPAPDTNTYALLLTTISRSNDKAAGQMSLDLLKELKESDTLHPTFAHYVPIVKSLGKDEKDSFVAKAIDIINDVDEMMYYDKPEGDKREILEYDPVMLYSAFLSGYNEGSRRRKTRSNTTISNYTINLLRRLDSIYKSTSDPRFKPDMVFYSSAIRALSFEDNDAFLSAQSILDELENLYRAGDSDVPSKHVFTATITSLAQSNRNEGAKEAEQVLNRMKRMYELSRDDRVKPDAVCITDVMNAWSKSNDPSALDRIIQLFQQMEDEAHSGNLSMKPTKLTYTVMINALGKRGKAEEAEEIIKVMDKRYADGEWNVKPDTYAFASVINAWKQSSSCEKAEKAWNVFLDMKDRYEGGDKIVKPNSVCLTSIISACGNLPSDCNNETKRKAVEIALKAFQQITHESGSYGSADSILYMTTLSTLRKLTTRKESYRYAKLVFQKCCQDGYVNLDVIRALRRYNPDLYKKLPLHPDGKVNFAKMPKGWYRKARRAR